MQPLRLREFQKAMEIATTRASPHNAIKLFSVNSVCASCERITFQQHNQKHKCGIVVAICCCWRNKPKPLTGKKRAISNINFHFLSCRTWSDVFHCNDVHDARESWCGLLRRWKQFTCFVITVHVMRTPFVSSNHVTGHNTAASPTTPSHSSHEEWQSWHREQSRRFNDSTILREQHQLTRPFSHLYPVHSLVLVHRSKWKVVIVRYHACYVLCQCEN